MSDEIKKSEGTILWVAPFYNRSGYGVLARAAVSALHRDGVRVRIFSVNEVEPGIDDVDMELIKSLEKTPIVPPVTIIISHVPSKQWFEIKVPEPKIMIITTTFDSSAQGNLPPAEWMEVFDKMDQIWLQSYNEGHMYIHAGIPQEKVQVVNYPDPWKGNPVIPPVTREKVNNGKPFRFLSVAMFLPRRRWDTLIESYLEEFKNEENVELYLKVNYPPWHPVPGKPKQDLQDLITSLQIKTGSKAKIIIDDELGTRKGMVDIVDSCNVYVSTDTTLTAPVAEARVRQRLVILPIGLDAMDRKNYIGIEVDPNAKTKITENMLLYQPYHKGAFMPLLKIEDVKKALRKAFELPPEERFEMCVEAEKPIPGPEVSLPMIYYAITKGWEYKNKLIKESSEKNLEKIIWEGQQFAYHSLALINREITSRLIQRKHNISLKPSGPDQFFPSKDEITYSNRIFYNKFDEAEMTVRHHWPPNLNPPESGYWINIQPWEYGSLPKAWADVFKNQVDEMWVPSNYVKKVYIDSGVPEDRVFVIPNGVDTSKFNPLAKSYKLKTKKKIKFLYVGGTIFRKGIDILLEAYTKSFSAKDDVCLVIKDIGGKSFYNGQTAQSLISEIKKNSNSPEIEYIDKNLNEKELIGLYTACNILVHPYRGEGFGLPVLEAMACGLPVVVTGGGATDDFCKDEFSFKVESSVAFVNENKIDNLITVDRPWLLNPSLEDLIEKMKFASENPDKLKEIGLKAAEFVRNNYSWENVVDIIEDRILKVTQKEIVRFTVKKQPPLEMFGQQFSKMKVYLNNKEIVEARDSLYSAIEYFKQIKDKTNIDIDYITLLNIAGNINLALNDLGSAQRYFEELLNIDPDSSQACLGLGLVFKEAELYEQSKVMLEWAVKYDSENKKAANILANVNNLLGLPGNDFSLDKETTAKGQNENAIMSKTKETLSDVLSKVYEIFSEKQYNIALKILKVNKQLFYSQYNEDGNNEIISAYENLKGLIYLSLNDNENARLSFESALQLNPESSQACAGLGEIFYLEGKDKEAKTMYEFAVKNNSDNQFALAGLAKVNEQLGYSSVHNTLITENELS